MKPALISLIFFCFIGLLFADTETTTQYPDHTATIEASGKSVTQADQAQFVFEVKSYGKTLREAYVNANTKITAIIGELKKLGLDDRCFSTGHFGSGANLFDPAFFNSKKDFAASVSTTITLKVEQLALLNDVVLTLTDQNVESISAITFSLSDAYTYSQQARDQALQRINEKKQRLELTCGILFSDVLDVKETYNEEDCVSSISDLVARQARIINSGGELHVRGERSNEVVFTVDGSTINNHDSREKDVSDAVPNLSLFIPEIHVTVSYRFVYQIGLKP